MRLLILEIIILIQTIKKEFNPVIHQIYFLLLPSHLLIFKIILLIKLVENSRVIAVKNNKVDYRSLNRSNKILLISS